MTIRSFGRLADQQEVQEIKIRRGELSANILTYGAVLRRLRFEGRDVAVGFDSIEDYLHHAPELGAIIGPDGPKLQRANEAGGKRSEATSFARHLWTLDEASADSVQLSLNIPSQHVPHTGFLEISCRYTITPNNTLQIELEGACEHEVVFNPRFHGVFNLNPDNELSAHEISIPACGYTSLSSGRVPFIQISDVAGTPYDLRDIHKMRPHRATQLNANYYMRLNRLQVPELSAVVHEETTGTKMEVWSTEPGLFYEEGREVFEGSKGNALSRCTRQGFSIEPQGWPEGTEKHDFSNVILRPGEIYKQRTEFRFS
ncbi:hypothetical protein [Pseudovibrio sp. SPO723]|uniref:aldose epimerase family protein n=1 Tax=Nesiotobacter zosterae TaxID=392721 RepID=UPI0029C1FB13|nr:hypothetical protein [Pseudovibrio sp. SPO723]MDX5592353.1 hypothetical protein [Pseudovibrio sp. SPO723]